MSQYDKSSLERIASQYGFLRDPFEKVLRISEILRFFNSEEYLKEHLCLKGGTAINLTIFNLPRLSFDIDMDFIPNLAREDMLEARVRIGEIIKRYMNREGYVLSDASRFHHSLDAFLYSYQNAGGNTDSLKIELNYSLRSHLFASHTRLVLTDAFVGSTAVQCLDPLEIYAAKANALLSRAAARDLYDFCKMIEANLFENRRDLLRKSIVFYASVTAEKINKSFDTREIDNITFARVKRDLFPAFSQTERRQKFDVDVQVTKAKEFLSDLMVLTDKEEEYIDRFEAKDYCPELLFDDPDILSNIQKHPMALWKCK